jgi:hypothetical protein
MNNPLFKHPDVQLSPREEAEITQDLANAYRQNEIGEKKPEFKRIAESIKKKINDKQNGGL